MMLAPHLLSSSLQSLELEVKALLSSVVMAYANSSTFSLWSSFSIHESKRIADSLEASASAEGIWKSSSSTVSLTAFLSSWKDADIQKKYVQCLLAHNFVTYEFIFTGCPPKYTFSIQCHAEAESRLTEFSNRCHHNTSHFCEQ